MINNSFVLFDFKDKFIQLNFKLFRKIKQYYNFYFLILKFMKRASEIQVNHKKSNYIRKMSRSAFFKPSQFLFLKQAPIFTAQSHMLSHQIIQDCLAYITNVTELAIQQIQQHNFCLRLKQQIETILNQVETSLMLTVQYRQQQNVQDQQPHKSYPDYLCGNQKLNQKKNTKNQACATVPTSPTKQISSQYRINHIRSSKQNRFSKLIHKSSMKAASRLVPLSFMDSQKDLRLTQLELVYREKCVLQEASQISQEIPKLMLTAGRFKNSKIRQNQQFNFDYNGEKIPIAKATALKKNQMNVLKTVCYLQKDKTDIRNSKKIYEKIIFEQMFKSKDNLFDVIDVQTIKKGIQSSVSWQGKLSSLNIISEANEIKMSAS